MKKRYSDEEIMMRIKRATKPMKKGKKAKGALMKPVSMYRKNKDELI